MDTKSTGHLFPAPAHFVGPTLVWRPTPLDSGEKPLTKPYEKIQGAAQKILADGNRHRLVSTIRMCPVYLPLSSDIAGAPVGLRLRTRSRGCPIALIR